MVDELQAPLERLGRHWESYWPGADVEETAADVRARLGRAVAAWGVSDVQPLAGGNVALVCAARRNGGPVILKVHPRGHGEEAQLAGESDALRFWAPTGAVPRVFDGRDGGLTILMERLGPGLALDRAGLAWDDALTVLGGLAARLHAAAAPPAGFTPMSEYASAWRGALSGEPALVAELDRLIVPAATDVLVHADLHGGNALRHAARGR